MGYTPTVWQTGDIVSSEKLNKIENGIVNAIEILVVTMSGDPLTSDKTWQEIYNAVKGGSVAVINNIDESDGYDVTSKLIYWVSGKDGYGYAINAWDFANDSSVTYEANSADGYPQESGDD